MSERLRVGARTHARWLHPGAWWAWALGCAAAASRTTNPLLLVLLGCAVWLVVSARRPAAPWGRSFDYFVRLGVAVIVVRVLVQVLFGASIGSTVLLPLPGLALPGWMAGVRLGGDVMLESVLAALLDGLRLATILVCVGAANSLASPTRLLKSVPAALYEFGVAVVVALTFTPALVADVTRVQSARRLRGRAVSGPRAIAGAAMPVLDSALERSVTLAAAMDSRGYGRRRSMATRARRTTAILLGVGLVAACIGVFGLVSAGSPWVLQLPMLVVGLGASVLALAWSARGAVRTRYRPDPWWTPEWLVTAAGAFVAAAFVATSWSGPASMAMVVDPPSWPTLPLVPVLGALVAASPAITAPLLPEPGPVSARPAREAVAA